jgi:hypothetical protein
LIADTDSLYSPLRWIRPQGRQLGSEKDNLSDAYRLMM